MNTNNLLFFINILVASGFTLAAFRLGKICLITWIVTQAMLANIFVLKQINLLGFNVTASDVFAVSGFFSIALMHEYYSQAEAKKVIWACMVSLAFFAIASQLHLSYTPNRYDFAQPAYQTLFGPNIRIICASVVAYGAAQFVNIWALATQKEYCHNLPFSIQAVIAVLSSQAVDTIIFSFLALHGLLANIIEIIIFSFIVKSISVIALSHIPACIKRLKNSHEHI